VLAIASAVGQGRNVLSQNGDVRAYPHTLKVTPTPLAFLPIRTQFNMSYSVFVKWRRNQRSGPPYAGVTGGCLLLLLFKSIHFGPSLFYPIPRIALSTGPLSILLPVMRPRPRLLD